MFMWCFNRLNILTQHSHRKNFILNLCKGVNRLTSTVKSTKYRYPRTSPTMLRTIKIDTPEFHALFTPELKDLIALFEKHNYELRIAGGAVRDLLMGKQSHDIDFATTATPDEMKEMFELEKVRMINASGESHGTITPRINDKENFEVTTLRIDIRTDGRHAEVQFTTDWQMDANRRDLTINSMFLGFDGTVYDYFNGIEDVQNRKVRFVGHPEDRVQEDYLRILRYFRFYGRIAKDSDGHEEATLRAIRENAEGLGGISGERIWMELKRIVVGNFAGSLMKVMHSVDITKYMGLPADSNVEEFQCVCERTEGCDPEPMTRMAALLATEEQVYALNTRLKVSTDELKTALFIVQHRDTDTGQDILKFCKHLVAGVSGKEPKTKSRVCELMKYKGLNEIASVIKDWQPPRFPITGQDLLSAGVKKGPRFGVALNELRKQWIKSDFTLTRDELISQLPDVMESATKTS